jgi:hypothetical protein
MARMIAMHFPYGMMFDLNEIMKIAFLSLSFLICPIALLAQANSLTNVVLFTPNLTFYLQKQWEGGKPTQAFNYNEMICRTLAANGTNIFVYRSLPQLSQIYSFKLINDKGDEVLKTERGLANSMSPVAPTNPTDLHRHFKIQSLKGHDVRDLFRASDMFIVTNSGVYRLEVKMRICVPLVNGVPDTTLMTNLMKLAACDNLTVFESPVVSVDIVKK